MIACLVLISLVCFIYFLKRQWEKEHNRPPLMTGAWPIIGHTYLFIGSLADSRELWLLVQKIATESLKIRGVLAIKICSWTWYATAEPDDVYNVANNCLEKDEIYKYVKPWLGEGLFTGELSIWKIHRKMISPAFNNKRSRSLVETLSLEVGKGPVILSDYIEQFTLDIILLTLMGLDFEDENINQNNEYLSTISSFFMLAKKRALTVWMNIDFMYNLTKDKKQMDQAIKILNNFADELIKKRKAALKLKEADCCNNKSTDKGSTSKSFLNLLLDLSTQGSLTDIEIRDEVNTIILGGYDTTAKTLMNVLVMIGSFPHVQKRVYDELKDVFENDSKDVDNDDLARLEYLEAVIKEALRLCPVGPVIMRRVGKDIQLKNCCLPAGSSCFLFMNGLNRHPIWGPDAEEFKPERWLDPALLPDHPGAYGSFSIGRRSCIGKTLAMKLMKITLSHILRRYKLSADYTKITWAIEVLLIAESENEIALEYRPSNIYNN